MNSKILVPSTCLARDLSARMLLYWIAGSARLYGRGSRAASVHFYRKRSRGGPKGSGSGNKNKKLQLIIESVIHSCGRARSKRRLGKTVNPGENVSGEFFADSSGPKTTTTVKTMFNVPTVASNNPAFWTGSNLFLSGPDARASNSQPPRFQKIIVTIIFICSFPDFRPIFCPASFGTRAYHYFYHHFYVPGPIS